MDKARIRKLIMASLGNAEDNLHRAKAAFCGIGPDGMAKEHGESGQTRAELLAGYQAERDAAAKLLEDFDAGR